MKVGMKWHFGEMFFLEVLSENKFSRSVKGQRRVIITPTIFDFLVFGFMKILRIFLVSDYRACIRDKREWWVLFLAFYPNFVRTYFLLNCQVFSFFSSFFAYFFLPTMKRI